MNKNLKTIILDTLKNAPNERATNIFLLKYGFLTDNIPKDDVLASLFNLKENSIDDFVDLIINFIIENSDENLKARFETIKNKMLKNLTDGAINQDFVRKTVIEEFEKFDLIYLDLLKRLTNTEIELPQNKIQKESPKEIILSLVKEFSGQYGRGGISKILKGSKLKENDFNANSVNSVFYGALRDLTHDCIKSLTDELIEEGALLVQKKGNFARPVLVVNPDKTYEEPQKPAFETKDKNIIKILDLLNNGENVFITGHAGTGKSYILNKLKEALGKDLTITSTTGIAAVNVKGQTLHSFAGVGICNMPVNLAVEKILKKSAIKNQIQKCKILAVDEISMLDINTLEYVDAVLKCVRENELPFGGIQTIFIGDFFQLPPVDKTGDDIKKYCFESKVWNDLNLNTILLTENHRQNEQNLITALSNMRTNNLTPSDIKLLKTREFVQSNDPADILHIFATNQEADNFNLKKFKEVDAKEYVLASFDGVYQGKKLITGPTNTREENIFKRMDSVCSAEKFISLKIGARVMLLINQDFERGLINGSCGVVEDIDDEEDFVKVHFDNGVVSEITKHDFEFYNNDTLIAVRKQFPLRLAYGITIHKSQGMSLDKLVVDCARIFEKGQTYVALSRIKTLKGLYLHNFSPNKVKTDEKVVDFYKSLKPV